MEYTHGPRIPLLTKCHQGGSNLRARLGCAILYPVTVRFLKDANNQ
jgi:hypothetical protein